MSKAEKWYPQPEISFECADISFRWGLDAALTVVMHFSDMVVGHKKDLELRFERVAAVKWEDGSFDVIPVPDDLPRLYPSGSGRTFPTMIVRDSAWSELYTARRYAEGDPEAKKMVHYLMLSLNDTLHVLAGSPPESRWIEPEADSPDNESEFSSSKPIHVEEAIDDVIARIARGLIEERVDFLSAVRELSRIASMTGASSDSNLALFVGLDSDTDHMPDDSRRHLCAKEWLEKCDRELAEIKNNIRTQMVETCKALIEEFG